MSTLEEIARFGFPASIASGTYKSEHVVSQARLVVQKVAGILEEWKRTVQSINTSTKYTEEGRLHLLGEAAASALNSLSGFNSFIAKWQTATDERRKALVVVKAEPDPAVDAYMWDNLPTDGLLLADIARSAIERGDQRVFDAIRTMPFFKRPVDDDTIARWEADWAAKRSPEKAQEVRDMMNAVKVAQAEVDRAARLVRSDAKIKEPDEIQRIAVGGGV